MRQGVSVDLSESKAARAKKSENRDGHIRVKVEETVLTELFL